MPDAPNDAASRLVVWDFDGTVCLGDDPVRAYAAAAAARLAPADAAELHTRLTGWLAGGTVEDAIDGYALVASLAAAGGLGAAALSAAYHESRAALHAGRIAVRAPQGLAALLRGLLQSYALPADALLSVGDIWVDDLEPAALVGGTTALVDRFGRAGGAPDLRAATLPELYPDLEKWWSG